MNTRNLLAFLLFGLFASHIEGIIIITTTASALATGAAALAIGALAVIKGTLIVQALSRRKRDLTEQEQNETVEIALDVASQLDTYNCVPKLLCEIEATSDSDLTTNMAIFKNAFGKPQGFNTQTLKTPRGSFDLAITFGSKIAKGSPASCDRLFENCPLSKEELLAMLDSTLSC